MIEAFEVETMAADARRPDRACRPARVPLQAADPSPPVTVGIARLTLFVAESHSLKDKRMVLRRVKDLVR